MVTRQLPWPGPRPYTDELTAVFRGRDKERSRLLTQLQGQKLSVMTASSGAGKTSLLQAGVIPQIREYRLRERRGVPGRLPSPPFPMLLNQWLERAGKGERLDYGHLITLEIHLYLRHSLEWYEKQSANTQDDDLRRAIAAETTSIEDAIEAIADFAEKEHFGKRDSAEKKSALMWVEAPTCGGDDCADRMTDRLLEVLDIASEHLGEVLLVLDQFEEILLDWRLGQQALDAVESVFLLRRTTVRQLISMRHDGLHLVDQLEAKGLLENKRRVKIEPLSKSSVEQIIREVSAEAGHEWLDSDGGGGASILERMVQAFTYSATGGGTRAGEVNLVGLQVVLNGMFRGHLSEDESVSEKTLRDYCASLSSTDSDEQPLTVWLEEGRLAHLAPRAWILECLTGSADVSVDHPDEHVFELQVQPLAARMSWLLVTPAGNKRTMTGDELHDYAYKEDADELDEDDLAGLAREQGWSKDEYLLAMRATCDEALARLTRGNVLKKRGSETGEGIAYELVHDQFGKPFQAWAEHFEATPEFDLNALQALKSRPFKWTGALRPHDDDGIIPHARWEDCTLREVDLSDLTFEQCDFGESLFHRCTFDDVIFRGCDLTNVTFKECSFDRVSFERCTLTSTSWIEGTTLRSVRVLGAQEGSEGHGMSFAQMRGAIIEDCHFSAEDGLLDEYDAKLLLPMRYIQFVDCRFEGESTFTRCRMDGGTLRGWTAPARVEGSLLFDDCYMASFEVSYIDVTGRKLQIHDCNCRGASFDRIDGGRDENGTYADIDFARVTLVGATMTGCRLEDVCFIGRQTTDADPSRTDVSTFVIADHPRERRSARVRSKIGKITFKDLDAENMSIERCEITGDVLFDNCMLSGATFVGDPGHDDELGTRRVEGELRFINGCDLTAAEFNGLSFTDVHSLRIADCDAGGSLFLDVAMNGERSRPAAVFERTDLSGALILGSSLRHVEFVGENDAEGFASTLMPTLTVKPGPKKGKHLPAVFSQVGFRDIAMPGFVFQEISVEDDIRFEHCDLGGGTIGRLDKRNTERLRATGDLHFIDCRMDAIEFSFLQFTDESIKIRGCDCKGALFQEIGFDLVSNKEDGLLVEASDMTGALFLDCQITRATFSGASREDLSPGVTMTFRESKGDRADLGHTSIENYVLDGGSFEGLAITGSVDIRNCSLLRTKFEDIEFEGEAHLDISESDLLYAQVDPRLVSDQRHFRMTDHQRAGVESLLPHQALLQLQSLPESS